MTNWRRSARLRRSTSLLLCAVAMPAAVHAQLQVLHRTPADSGTAGALISVTFNRPVAGMLGNSIDPRRAMTITPTVAGVTEWRDPSTIRFLPTLPFTPGAIFSVSVDTAAIASNGGRSAQPFTFTARFPGATPLAMDVASPSQTYQLGPMPVLRILYSAPVNLDSAALLSRLVFAPRCGGTIQLRPVRQRPVVKGDGWAFENAGGADRDTVADRFRRVVEMTPVDSLPPACMARWHVVSFDPARPGDTWNYEVGTAPLFRVLGVTPCLLARDNQRNVCDPDGLEVAFSSAMKVTDIATLVRVSPELPPPQVSGTSISTIRYTTRLTPRTNYTVSIDTAVRDVFGRRLTGPSQHTVRSNDRAPGVKQQNGLATIPRGADGTASVSVRVVNIDTLQMLIRAIPDSLIGPVLGTPAYVRRSLLATLDSLLTDTITVAIPVRASFNAETTLVVPLPGSLGAPGSPAYHSIRFAIAAPSVAPYSAAARAARRTDARTTPGSGPVSLQPVTVSANLAVDLGLIAQVSNIAAHSRIGADRGAVFVTDRAGTPLGDASITLNDANRTPLASGRSGSDGLATVNALSFPTAVGPVPISRNPGLESMRYLHIVKGSDRLILPVSFSAPSVSTANFESWMLGAATGDSRLLRGAVTTDRDIYRPGEKLFARAVVRYGMFAEMSPLAGDSVHFFLIGEDTISMRRTTLSAFGTAVDSLIIPPASRLGYYSVEARVQNGGRWQVAAVAGIRVAEFRAPDFLVTLAADSLLLFDGDSASLRLSASYLLGTPMSGANIKWSAVTRTASPWELAIPGAAGYQVGQSFWWGERDQYVATDTAGTDSLDASGNRLLRIRGSTPVRGRPARMQISTAIVDANNQVVTSSAGVTFHSSSFYAAAKVRGNNWYWRTGTPQTVDVIAVRPDGQRLAGVPLRVAIVRRTWAPDTTPDAPAGTFRYSADTVERMTVTSALDSVPIHFTPLLDGAYDIRIEVTDEKGRSTITNLGRWVSVYAWFSQPGVNPIKLHVATQRESNARFALGDTVLLQFDSPFADADAWLTLEREGILEQRVVRVARGTAQLRIPVTTQHAPNIWASVALIRRRGEAARGSDSLAAETRVGYANIRVDSTAHMLRLAITPQAQRFLPGDTARIRVSVSDVSAASGPRGVRAEVALWALDEGVLSLTGFRTPDILRLIDGERGVAQSFRSTLSFLPWMNATGSVRPGSNVPFWGYAASGARAPFSVAMSGSDMLIQIRNPLAVLAGKVAMLEVRGEEAEQGAIPLRSNFRFAAFYVGAAVTDDSGNAIIRAQLPDNITTFRLMATAVTAGHRYGSGEASLLVTRSVVVRPALPRFVRHGDEFSASAVVNLNGISASTLDVSIAATNASVNGGTTKRVAATELKGAVPRFSMRLPQKSDATMTRVTFTARDALLTDGDGDAVESVLPIRPTGAPRAHVAIGVVRGSGTVTLNLPGDIDPDFSTVTLSLGSSPVVAMRTHYEQLRAYPYYCTEQIVTAARALLALRGAERVLGYSDVVTRDSIAVMIDVQRAVDELLRRRLPSGHFSFFPDGRFVIGPWLTAYVGTFLLEARNEGAVVPQRAIAAIADGLSSDLASPDWWAPDTISGAPWQRRSQTRRFHGERLVIASFLRDAGSPYDAVEEDLIAGAAQLSWEDRVALADLLSRRSEVAGSDAQGRVMLADAWRLLSLAGKRLEIPDSLRGSAPFPSHIRPAARLLSATMKMDAGNPLVGALAETLIQQGAAERNYTWNTQDYGAAIGALASYVAMQRPAAGARVVLRSRQGRVLMSRVAGEDGSSADSVAPLRGLIQRGPGNTTQLTLQLTTEPVGAAGADQDATPFYYAVTVNEVSLRPPVTPNIAGITVERWYERFEDGTPVTEVSEGDLVQVRLRITVPADRQFVAVEDLLPAGLEVVDLSLRTSGTLGPFLRRNLPQSQALSRLPSRGPVWQSFLYGGWDGGWWSPWEYKEMRDDRVLYFARQLWTGTYHSSYVARATTAGSFIRPPAQAVEMYNPALQGRSDGGVFVVKPR